MTKRHGFRPHPFLTVAALLLVLLMLRLAFWQFDRAAEKHALELAAATATVTVTLRAAATVRPFQRAELVGEYLPAESFLLDNRIHHRRAGYHVATPFALADGGVVMVLRGWLANDGRREVLPVIPPPPRGRVTIGGAFVTDSANAVVLSDVTQQGRLRQQLDLAAIAAETGLSLMTLAFVLMPSAADSLTPIVWRTNFKSAQSTIYAWQWLTFALLTVVFYVILGRRRGGEATK